MDVSKPITDVFTFQLFTLVPLMLLMGIIIILIKVFQDKIIEKVHHIWTRISNDDEHALTEDIREIISSVNSDLSELRAELYADRAVIYHFHNGTQFTSKYPSWKISNTFIKVKPSVSNRSRRFQNIEVSLMWDDFIKAFWNKADEVMPNGVYVVADKGCSSPNLVLLVKIHELSYSGQTRIELESQGIYCFLATAIFDANRNNIIGFVAVDYNDKEEFNELYNDESIDFCKLAKFSLHLTTYFSLTNIPEQKFIDGSKKYNILNNKTT